MVFSVPRVVSYEQETEHGIEVEEFPVVCVASGELMEQVRCILYNARQIEKQKTWT